MMNTAKLRRWWFILLCVVIGFNVNAETMPFKVMETDSLNILVSNDGTGIIKDIECKGCDFNIVKVTSASKATANGIEVSMSEAKSRAGKFAMVSFDPETRVVQYVRWRD